MAAPAHSAPPSGPCPQLSGEALLLWRRQQLDLGGEATALDWLLDLEGGIGWQQLQQLRLNPNSTVSLRAPMERLQALWQRHCGQHDPLQYLVGQCPWRDLTLKVAPGVLIPRQETELLVDLALELWQQHGGGRGPRRWADLGTGSGCLAVALAPGGWLLLEHHHDQSDAVAALLKGAGLVQVSAYPDLEGKRRFASARAPEQAWA